MKDNEQALQLFDLFEWAIENKYCNFSISTFEEKYPKGKKRVWSAYFFYQEDRRQRYMVEGNSIQELYRKMEQQFLTGKGAKAVEKDEDLL